MKTRTHITVHVIIAKESKLNKMKVREDGYCNINYLTDKEDFPLYCYEIESGSIDIFSIALGCPLKYSISSIAIHLAEKESLALIKCSWLNL